MRDRSERLLKAADLDLQDRLEKLARADRRLRELADERTSLTSRRVDSDDLAILGGAVTLWNRWCERRIRDLGAEEARLRAERDELRTAAARAFGRQGVLRKLGTQTGMRRR